MGRSKVKEGSGKQFPPRKRSIPYGFDFDLDEVWAPLNPHLRIEDSPSITNVHKAKANPMSSKNIGSCQSLRKTSETKKQDSGEFDTEGEIFRDKETDLEREKKAILDDIAGLSGHLGDVDLDMGQVMRDAYGREIRRRDSLESTWHPGDSSPLAASVNSSPFSTMSKIQLSTLSSASSRNSSNSGSLPTQSRHRSFSNSENSSRSAPGREKRRLSAGSVASSSSRMSRLSHSPGLPRKVSNSANMLTTGLAMEKRRKAGSRAGSRGHSPNRQC